MESKIQPVEAILADAVEIPDPEGRRQFIERACGSDLALKREIERLIGNHLLAGSFLEVPAIAELAEGEPTRLEQPGTAIGPYKLLEQIGEGGFGIVFMAEQQHPVRRKVALKVIKPGMDTRQVIARFEAERQALALMDHPNIARVLDAGATDSGRPYFAMDLIKGIPITAYCDQNQLTPRERLHLFISVCQAVQHAHQKGVIHRDLKPSNILVTLHDGTPVVKIIDFGIAKAVGHQLTDKTIFTGFAQMIGTPLYMSPEQAALSSVDVDTRSDIYSLGVVLYELLAGATPFDYERLHKAGYDEMRRIIREEEPPRPSTRLSTLGQAGSTISAQRKSDPKQLCKMLRGELDWIVMKALEKVRDRRYESASALAGDIQRYLDDEPVQACPPSPRYRLGKFLRRHRTSVVITAILLTVAVAAAASIGWMARDQATRQTLLEQAVDGDLKEAKIWEDQKLWAKALPALERANGRLIGLGLDSLQAQVEKRRKDATLAGLLEKVGMQAALPSTEVRSFAVVDRAYRSAFAENGLDVTALAPEEVARRIRASAISSQLVTALDNWANYNDWWKPLQASPGESLRAIAQLADKDPWRRQLRDPRVTQDLEALVRLAESDAVTSQTPETLMILFHLLEAATNKAEGVPRGMKALGPKDPGVTMLLRVQPQYPQDFWINFNLGCHLANERATAADAIGFSRAALAVYPQYSEAYYHIGRAFWRRGNPPEAEAAFRKSIQLRPDSAHAYNGLVQTLRAQKKLLEMEAACLTGLEILTKAIDQNILTDLTLYDAACFAALAGCSQHEDTVTRDTKERARLRGKALGWLRTDLTALKKDFAKAPAKESPRALRMMRYWQLDTDFDGVRGNAALAKLPEEERQEWRKLWEEVEELEQSAAASHHPAGPK